LVDIPGGGEGRLIRGRVGEEITDVRNISYSMNMQNYRVVAEAKIKIIIFCIRLKKIA